MKPVVIEGVAMVGGGVKESVAVRERGLVEPEMAMVPERVLAVRPMAEPGMPITPGHGIARRRRDEGKRQDRGRKPSA